MNFIVILIFLLTYSNSTIKFTGDGDIKLSQLDAFLEAFVDELFIFFQECFYQKWATPITKFLSHKFSGI